MRKGNKERKKITDTGWQNKEQKNEKSENENYYSGFKIAAGCRRQPALWSHLPTIFHRSNRKLHLIGEINVTGTCHSKYFISEEVMQP